MTLKARLTIAVVVLLVALTGVLGVITVRATRSSMVSQVDERLDAIRDRPPGPGGFGGPGGPTNADSQERYRDVADFLYSPQGRLLFSRPAGFGDDPESPPDLPKIPSAAFAAIIEHPTTLPSTDGSLDYRVLVFMDRGPNIRVMAQSLTDINESVSSLTETFLLAGLAMVLIGAAVSWLVIRRSLRPIEGMIDTASAIASGDLSKRVDHDDDGTELGRLAHALDDMLGQLEVAFDERLTAQAQLEQFVADASHELRTPVTAIRGYAELYRGGGIKDTEQLDRAMRRIEQESTRMGALVEDLLLLARLDEQQPLERESVDLTALAEDAVTDARTVDRDRLFTLHAPGPVLVLGDERSLRQVLANLLTNAASPHAGARPCARRGRARRRPRAARRRRRGPRHQGRRSPPDLRALLPRRPLSVARTRRFGPRPVDRRGRCRGTRWHRGRGEPRRRWRGVLRRAPRAARGGADRGRTLTSLESTSRLQRLPSSPRCLGVFLTHPQTDPRLVLDTLVHEHP